MASLKDIAAEAGVSVPLVSKVLNNRLGSTGASDKTIETIRGIAQRLGYRRNEAAAALRTGRQGVIGVLVHRQGAPGSGLNEAMLDGIVAGCGPRELRQQLTFYTGADEFRRCVRAVQPATIDGLIISGVSHPDLIDEILAAKARGVAIVTTHSSEIHDDIPNAGCRDLDVGRIATEHLIERGCRTIVHVCGMAERDRGYRQALRAAGHAYRPDLVVEVSGFDHKVGAAAVKHMVDGGIEFDGVFADSDQQAMGAMRELYRRGLRVPRDVKVIGVDDSPFCECAIVSLSSVSGCDYQRGQLAVNMLLGCLEGVTVRSVNVDPLLQPRESSEVDAATAGTE